MLDAFASSLLAGTLDEAGFDLEDDAACVDDSPPPVCSLSPLLDAGMPLRVVRGRPRLVACEC